jgi:hypothetical protein
MNAIAQNAEKRRVIQLQIDDLAQQAVTLDLRMRELQKQFRQLELDDRRERLNLEAVKVPTGIMK